LEGRHDLVARHADVLEVDARLAAGAIERQRQGKGGGAEGGGGDRAGVLGLDVAGDRLLEKLEDELDARHRGGQRGTAERQGAEAGARATAGDTVVEDVEGGFAAADADAAQEAEEVGEIRGRAERRTGGGCRADAGGGEQRGDLAGGRRLWDR